LRINPWSTTLYGKWVTWPKGGAMLSMLREVAHSISLVAMGCLRKNSCIPVGRREIKITPHISQVREHFQVVLDVSNGRAILIGVHVHQVQWSKMASDSDDHGIAMVHDVGAKLRLNRAYCMINVSKDTQLMFGQVKPFWVQGDPI
jgi:hypothetical protein